MTKQKYLKGVPLAKLCAIIGDGHTEKIYFQALKEQEKPLKLTIKDKNDKEQYVTVNLEPKLPSKSGGSYKNVFEKAQELLQEKYDYIFCIIDYDTVLSTKQTQQYQKQKNALEKRGVVIVECNPCFEIWYLLHFQNTTKIFENCEKIAIDLKKIDFFKDYHKTKDYYVGLKPYLQTAVKNAEILMKNEMGNENATRCDIQQIIHALNLI